MCGGGGAFKVRRPPGSAVSVTARFRHGGVLRRGLNVTQNDQTRAEGEGHDRRGGIEMQCYTESRIVPDGEYEAILRRIDVHRPRRDLRKENSLKPGDSVTCWVFLSFEILAGAPGAEGPLRSLHCHQSKPSPEFGLDPMQSRVLEVR